MEAIAGFKYQINSFSKTVSQEIANVVREQTVKVRNQIVKSIGKGGMPFGELSEEAGVIVVENDSPNNNGGGINVKALRHLLSLKVDKD